MKTLIPKNIRRKWFLIDAAGKKIGKIATVASKVLRGKDKVIFTPHLDCGDGVILINVGKIDISDKKLKHKSYFSHSRYSGGLKEVSAEKIFSTNPEKLLHYAVFGMLSKNRFRKEIIKRLRIFEGSEHNLQAQKPEVFNF